MNYSEKSGIPTIASPSWNWFNEEGILSCWPSINMTAVSREVHVYNSFKIENNL